MNWSRKLFCNERLLATISSNLSLVSLNRSNVRRSGVIVCVVVLFVYIL